MVKRSIFVLLAVLPWAIAVGAGAVALRTLLGQLPVERQLTQAMGGVLNNMQEANRLTRQTAAALAPLRSTTVTLTAINQRLQSTADDLDAINASMERISATQRHMLGGVRALAAKTGETVAALRQINQTNQAVYGTARSMSAQTAGQANLLDNLTGQTEQAIAYLRTTNDRFAFLRRY